MATIAPSRRGEALRRCAEPDLGEFAAQLRLAITRTARRLRQEAGTDLSPEPDRGAGDDRLHGPLTPSELASMERVQRPTATRIVARLEEEGLIARAADPVDGRSSLVSTHRGGPRADCGSCEPARTPISPGGCARSVSTRWRPSPAPPRSSSAFRMVSAGERRAPPLLHIPGRPELSALLRRPDRVAERQLDAGRSPRCG